MNYDPIVQPRFDQASLSNELQISDRYRGLLNACHQRPPRSIWASTQAGPGTKEWKVMVHIYIGVGLSIVLEPHSIIVKICEDRKVEKSGDPP